MQPCDLSSLWAGGTLCSWLCSQKTREFGKLLTLHAEDRACEGKPRKVPQSLSVFSVSPFAAYRVTGAVNGTLTTFVVDTEATVSLLRADLWEKIQSPGALLELWTNTDLVEANGNPIDVLGSATVTLTVVETAFPAWVVLVKQLTTEAILGVDFLPVNGCTVKLGKKILDFPNHGVSSPLIHSNSKYVLPPTGVLLVETVLISAFCEMEVMATTQTSVSECNWILKGEQCDKVPVVAACAVVSPVNEALDESDVIDSATVAVVHQSESFSHIDQLTKKQQLMWDLVEKNNHLDEN